jgi:hypothetical protein
MVGARAEIFDKLEPEPELHKMDRLRKTALNKCISYNLFIEDAQIFETVLRSLKFMDLDLINSISLLY